MGMIAAAVEHLIAAGVTGAALVKAIADMEAAAALVATKPQNDAAEKRRAYDRERKRRAAGKRNSTGISTGNDAESAEIPQPERNSGGIAEADPTLSLSPNENNSNPQTHTHPDNIPTREAPPVGGKFGPQDVLDMWNRAAGQIGLPKATKLSDARRKHAARLIRDHGEEGFRTAIKAIIRSRFLRGENDTGWRADVDFLLQPKSFLKLIEGAYDRSNRARPDHRHEPDGAMAYLQRSLGIDGDPQPAGAAGRWDDEPAGGGYLAPGSSA